MNFDPELEHKPRWLVFTKADLLPREEAEARTKRVLEALDWQSPWTLVSSATQSGTMELMQDIMQKLEEMDEDSQRAKLVESEPDYEMPETPPE